MLTPMKPKLGLIMTCESALKGAMVDTIWKWRQNEIGSVTKILLNVYPFLYSISDI